MKKLKINFCDFWPGFDKFNNYFVSILSKEYEIEISENPDFLFFSNEGTAHKKYNCTRIFYTGESIQPDFRECDFGISFELNENRRSLRFPLYNLYGNINELVLPKPPFIEAKKKHTGFCNMVVSNPHSSKRIDFFHQLNKYKKVDSGGKYLNNIGGAVADKRSFICKYKFTLAFENKSYPGYTTEKIIEPMFCKSMPVYWGNPFIAEEFNTKSFINWNDYGSDEAVIERIIELDQNEDLYEKVYNEPYFLDNKPNHYCDEERLVEFLRGIFDNHFPRLWYRLSRHSLQHYYSFRIFSGRIKNKLLRAS